MQSEDFKLIGKVVATSIVQGGPGLPVFHPAVYNYWTTGDYLGQVVDIDAVPETQVRELLKQVRMCI